MKLVIDRFIYKVIFDFFYEYKRITTKKKPYLSGGYC